MIQSYSEFTVTELVYVNDCVVDEIHICVLEFQVTITDHRDGSS